MTNEIKRSDTDLAVEFIQRGQDALGQANVVMLVRPDKIIEIVDLEIEKIRRHIEALRVAISRMPMGSAPVIMSRAEWQDEAKKSFELKRQQVEKLSQHLDSLELSIEDFVLKHSWFARGFMHVAYRGNTFNGEYIGESFSGDYRYFIKKLIPEVKAAFPHPGRDVGIEIELARTKLRSAKEELAQAEQEYQNRVRNQNYYDQYRSALLGQFSVSENDRNSEIYSLHQEIHRLEGRIVEMQSYISAIIAKTIGQM